MRALKCVAIMLCVLVSTTAVRAGADSIDRDLGTEILGPGDGWASADGGTSGGSAATPDQVYVVKDRQELLAALNYGIYPPPSSQPSNTPKIIYVDGMIDVNVDDNNQPLTCQDYYRDGYTLEGFLAAYDPAVWGRTDPTGPMEAARLASRDAQQARVRIRVGSNTTIVGLGNDAGLRGAWLDLRGTGSVPIGNIIIRNLTFRDTHDCFPEWSPTDGALGSWIAFYDSISLRYARNVWVDHNSFGDDKSADADLPLYFGALYQVHDGLLDITSASDLVTVSWNRFENHAMAMLIGSSDSTSADTGRLRVTIRHNLFKNIGQRAPRVRFGQVHVYNNYYRLDRPVDYGYSWGVGTSSAIYAENNFFKLGSAITPDLLIAAFAGTAIHESGTYVQARGGKHPVDVLAAYSAANDPDLSGDVGWTPTLFVEVQPTREVPSTVRGGAGPFRW